MLQWKKKSKLKFNKSWDTVEWKNNNILAERLFNKKIYLKRSEVSLRQDK